MRDSMIFYRSFYESLDGMTETTKAQVYDAIFIYGLDFKEPTFTDAMAKSLFTLIKPQIDANVKKYHNGNKPKLKQEISKTEAKDKQIESKTEGNVNVNVNDNDNVNVNKRFIIPSLQEVSNYCLERNKGVDAEKFINYYTSNGWLVGKNKMKDWKACVRTWEKSSLELPKQQKSNDQLFYENVMKQVNAYK
jgi:hypothetical protein